MRVVIANTPARTALKVEDQCEFSIVDRDPQIFFAFELKLRAVGLDLEKRCPVRRNFDRR